MARYPVEPLVRVALRDGYDLTACNVRLVSGPRWDETKNPVNWSKASRVFGLCYRTLLRARQKGGLTWAKADEAAAAIGRCPTDVWGVDW